MPPAETVLDRLRGKHSELGARLVAVGGPLEQVYDRAADELVRWCVRPLHGAPQVLLEGGDYPGTWLESTATIGAEVLTGFLPSVALNTFLDAQGSSDYGGMFAMSVVSPAPLFVIFLIGRRFLVRGMATTGIK